ncbi:hypothetical protein JNUCC0626_48095 [Lentzea sp. JNUCC 0626]|uniref:hypothetical protein n=1 Tax=Lentzea sp. JNUCC 0626 TaxID=3367513 RepID=UPI00374A8906
MTVVLDSARVRQLLRAGQSIGVQEVDGCRVWALASRPEPPEVYRKTWGIADPIEFGGTGHDFENGV